MARAKVKAMSATAEKEALKAVRLQLLESDHERLEKCARRRGLNLASYARQAVLEKIRADEGGSK
jgi:hypothetical protein